MALQDVFDVLLTIAIVALLALADRLIKNRGWPRVQAYLVAVGLGGGRPSRCGRCFVTSAEFPV